MSETCETCRFWGQSQPMYAVPDYHHCLRHAPTSVEHQWPLTSKNEWCGDYQSQQLSASRKTTTELLVEINRQVAGLPEETTT